MLLLQSFYLSLQEASSALGYAAVAMRAPPACPLPACLPSPKTLPYMTRHTNWTDECWVPLLRLYLSKPAGPKPAYSRPVVDLALRLHVPPEELHARMGAFSELGQPMVERIWRDYASSPRRLARAADMVMRMTGFGNAEEFYRGVAINETFERDFRPIDGMEGVVPVMLILTLDLYFRLVPPTMVAQTPEVAALARLMRADVQLVVDALQAFLHLDPCFMRPAPAEGPLLDACRDVWHRYGNADPTRLAAYAEQLKDYFG